MNIPDGISRDEWLEWCSQHVTKAVLVSIKEERDFLAASSGRGEILDMDSPYKTHANAARLWGQIESLDAMIEFIKEKREDEE